MCSRTLRDFGVPGRFYKMDHFQRRSPSYLTLGRAISTPTRYTCKPQATIQISMRQ